MSEPASVLNDLYGRERQLLLAVGASLAMGDVPSGALAEAERLAADCESAAGGGLDEHFDACREGAARLVELVEDACAHGTSSRARLEAARASHRRLRRLVWDVTGCEYVPCAKTEGVTR